MFNTFLAFLFRIDERGTEDAGTKHRIEVVDRVNKESSDRAKRARAFLSGTSVHFKMFSSLSRTGPRSATDTLTANDLNK